MAQRRRPTRTNTYPGRSTFEQRNSSRDYSSSELRRAISPPPSLSSSSTSYGTRSLRSQKDFGTSPSRYLSSRASASNTATASSAFSSRLRPSSPIDTPISYYRQSSFTKDDKSPASSYRRQSSFTRDNKDLPSSYSYTRQSSFTKEERTPSLGFERQSSFTREGSLKYRTTGIPLRDRSSAVEKDSSSVYIKHKRDRSSPTKELSSHGPVRDATYSSSKNREHTSSISKQYSAVSPSRRRRSFDSQIKDVTTSSGTFRRKLGSLNPEKDTSVSVSQRTLSPTHDYDLTEQTLARLRKYTELSGEVGAGETRRFRRQTGGSVSDTKSSDRSSQAESYVSVSSREGILSDNLVARPETSVKEMQYSRKKDRSQTDSGQDVIDTQNQEYIDSPKKVLVTALYSEEIRSRRSDSVTEGNRDTNDSHSETPKEIVDPAQTIIVSDHSENLSNRESVSQTIGNCTPDRYDNTQENILIKSQLSDNEPSEERSISVRDGTSSKHSESDLDNITKNKNRDTEYKYSSHTIFIKSSTETKSSSSGKNRLTSNTATDKTVSSGVVEIPSSGVHKQVEEDNEVPIPLTKNNSLPETIQDSTEYDVSVVRFPKGTRNSSPTLKKFLPSSKSKKLAAQDQEPSTFSSEEKNKALTESKKHVSQGSSEESDTKDGKKFSVPSKLFKESEKCEMSKDGVCLPGETRGSQRNPRKLFRRVSLPSKLSFGKSSGSEDQDFDDDHSEHNDSSVTFGLTKASSLDPDSEKDKHITLKKLKFWGRRDKSSDSSHSSDSRPHSPVCPSDKYDVPNKVSAGKKSSQTKAQLKIPGKQSKTQKGDRTTVKVTASPVPVRKATDTKVKISVESSKLSVGGKDKKAIQTGRSSLNEGIQDSSEKDKSSVKVVVSKKTGTAVDHGTSDEETHPHSPFARRRPRPSGRSSSLDTESSLICSSRHGEENITKKGIEVSEKRLATDDAVHEAAPRKLSSPHTPGSETLSRLKERRRRRRLVREQFLGISVDESQSKTNTDPTSEDTIKSKPITNTKQEIVKEVAANGKVPNIDKKITPENEKKPSVTVRTLSENPVRLIKQNSLPSIDQTKAITKVRCKTIASTVHQDIITAIVRENGSSGSEINIPSVAQLREKFASEEIENTAAIPWRQKESERPHSICGERLSPTEMQRFVENTPFSLDIRDRDEPSGLSKRVDPTLEDSETEEETVKVVRHDKYGTSYAKGDAKGDGKVKTRKEDAKKGKKKSPFGLSPERLKRSHSLKDKDRKEREQREKEKREKEQKEKERKEREHKEKERKEKERKEKEKKEKERKEKERREKEKQEKDHKEKDQKGREHHILDILHLEKHHKEKVHAKDKDHSSGSEEKKKQQIADNSHEADEALKTGTVSSLRTMFGRRKSTDKGGKSKHQLMRKDRATLAVGITSEILQTAQQIAQRNMEERERVEQEARRREEEDEREEARKASATVRDGSSGASVTDGKEKKKIAKKPKSEATKARQKKMAASPFKTYGGLTKTRSESQLNQGLHFVAADIPLDEPKPTDTTQGKEAVKSKEEDMAVATDLPRTRRRGSSMFEEGLDKFFGKSEATRHQSRREVTVKDFDLISSQSTDQLKSLSGDRIKIRPNRQHRSTQNPVKGLMNRDDVRLETETQQLDEEKGLKQAAKVEKKGGASEHPVIRRKKKKYKDPENLWRRHTMDLSLAASALAGLASTEDFTQVKLRKTEGPQEKLKDEYRGVKPVMLIHIKGRRSVQTRLVEPAQKSLNSGDCYVLVTKDELFAWIGKEANAFEKAKVTDIASRVLTKRELDCKAKDIMYINQESQENDSSAVRRFYKLINGDPQSEIRAASSIARDEDYEKGMIKTNMVYKVQWTEPPRLVPVEDMCGHLPQFHILDTKEVFVFDFGSEMYVWNGQQSLSGARKTVFALAKQEFEMPFKPNDPYNPLYPYGREDGSEEEGDGRAIPARPSWALLARLHEKAETILFREKFLDWPDPTKIIKMKGHVSCGDLRPSIPAPELKPCDPKLLMSPMEPVSEMILEGTNVGRGHGVPTKWTGDYYKEGNLVSTVGVTVWHINEYRHFALPQHNYGHFHSGEGYVIRWAYFVLVDRIASDRRARCHSTVAGRVRTAYFFWQGNDCSVNEKGAAAVMAVELDEERGPQIRVVQGKEPPCFLNLFKGGMIIHQGNITRGLYDPQKRDHLDENTERFTDTSKTRLYAVRNESAEETCLVQVKAEGQALRSRSCFILLLCDRCHMFLWNGSKASNHTKKAASTAAKILQQKKPMESNVEKCTAITLKEIDEGNEPNEFWQALGGKKYYHSLLTDKGRHQYQCRLWHLSSATGKFLPNEITCPSRMEGRICPYPFLQEDLYDMPQPALFILDAHSEVYVWEGWKPEEDDNVQTGSAKRRWDKDRQLAMRSALNYAQDIGKRVEMRVFVVYAGLEPACFKALFPYWKHHAGVAQLQKRDGKENDSKKPAQDLLKGFTKEFYTLEELQQIPPPQGVDPALLEIYLSPDDFQDAFKMNKDEFNKLPGWKQANLKKSLRLF